MPLASLFMYVSPPPVAQATHLFWSVLGRRARALGLEAPATLDDMSPDTWLRPDLLFGQTCGYPYVQHLRGKVQLVATPTYGLAGCDGPHTCSFIIVNAQSCATSIEDLRGARAAINEPGRGPGLPFITSAATPVKDLAILRRALAETIADPDLAETCDTLSLRGIRLLGDADYEVLAELDREAARHGYPAIA